MRPWFFLTLGCALLGGCADPQHFVPPSKTALGPRITQLYAPDPPAPAGTSAKICYGVENAKSVWISPPLRELSVSPARCVEVEPKTSTTYTLTAEGAQGRRVTQDITIGIGPGRVRIVNVNISSVEVKAGDPVTLCYQVANARTVTVDPPGYRGGPAARGCINDRPKKTTTYVVAVTGAGGDRDQESVTVRVR